MCLCPHIHSIETAVELIVLQHPTEVNRALGTVRILDLSLKKTKVFIGEDFTTNKMLLSRLEQPNPNTISLLLYPSKKSKLLTKETLDGLQKIEEKASGLTNKMKVQLIVIDGTWKKAYKMYQLNPFLHNLNAIHLSEELQGNYRLRKAPSDNALSTVEATYHALATLESDTNFKPLISAFDALIEMQMAHIPEKVRLKNHGC